MAAGKGVCRPLAAARVDFDQAKRRRSKWGPHLVVPVVEDAAVPHAVVAGGARAEVGAVGALAKIKTWGS